MEKGRICKVITVSVILIITFICIFGLYSNKMNEYEYIQKKVIETAEVDMGKGCIVRAMTYNPNSKEYQVKVVNDSINCEITYTVVITNNKTKELNIDKFIERKKIVPY